MNAAELAVLASRLDAALDAAGLEVVRGRTAGGNLAGWDPVDSNALLGAWLAKRYVLRGRVAVTGRASPSEMVRHLQLVRPKPAEQSAHAPEDQADGHRGVTKPSTGSDL